MWIIIDYVIKTVIMVVKGKKENVMIVIYEKCNKSSWNVTNKKLSVSNDVSNKYWINQ